MIENSSRRGPAWNTIVILTACLLFAAIAAVIPISYFTKARRESRLVQSQSAVWHIARAAIEQPPNEGKIKVIPLNQLAAGGRITDDMLRSPFGPVSDSRGDYWSYPDPIDEESIADTGMLLILYDRAMYESDDYVAVAFLDGDAMIISPRELDELITQPPNGAVDYDLPARRP
jgi:hypothetical protein